ncbi:aldehyde reductase [Pelomyxa schiedti]|nr:aldehyde reductase [Pelomyxa schiedti]
MNNFVLCSPTRIVFGRGQIAKLSTLVPTDSRVMLVYGGGSIKANGIYAQVTAAVTPVCEFGGIEPNPSHETCMKAVALAKTNNVNFLLAVGGGSVIDACKYITCAMNWTASDDPYDIPVHWGFGFPNEKAYEPHAKCPIGVVLTLPAAGSEYNEGSVVSHLATKRKIPFAHPSCFPVFSILDPTVTFSIPPRQLANGLIDSFVHVLEQYLGHYQMGRLQDRQAEAILKSLIEVAPTVMAQRQDYAAAADFMWCASSALNGLISSGVKPCWAGHAIGHVMTAQYGLDHAQTLALTIPAIMKHQLSLRRNKYTQMAERVFNYHGADAAEQAIVFVEEFFKSLGVHTRLSQYGLTDDKFEAIVETLKDAHLATEGNIGKAEIKNILAALL